MTDVKREASIAEAKKIALALEQNRGNIKHAAAALDMAVSTLGSKLKRNHPELLEKAQDIRLQFGHRRGRPRKDSSSRTVETVSAAWEKSGHRLVDAAKEVGIPATSFRELVLRYDLPGPRKTRRKKSSQSEEKAA